MWLSLLSVEEITHPLNYACEKGVPIVFGIINGRPFAFGSSCPHKGGPLQHGEIIDTRIRCPWHKYEFDVFTGKVVSIPYPVKYGKWRETGDLQTHSVEVVDNYLYIEFD